MGTPEIQKIFACFSTFVSWLFNGMFLSYGLWVIKDNISMLDVGIKIFEGLAFVISRLIYAITCEMV